MSWNFDNLDDFVAEDILNDDPAPDPGSPAAHPCPCQACRALERAKPPAAALRAKTPDPAPATPTESEGPTLAEYIMFSNRILRNFPDALRALIEAARIEYPDPLLAT